MRGIITSLAFNLPLAIIVFIPIYFLTRKKLQQSYHWGILVVLWLSLALVNPFQKQKMNTPTDTTSTDTISVNRTSSSISVDDANSASLADLKNVLTSLEVYYADNKSYPKTIDANQLLTMLNMKILPETTLTYEAISDRISNKYEGYYVYTYHLNGDRVFMANHDPSTASLRYFSKSKNESDDAFKPL
jgi:hypothetical protein